MTEPLSTDESPKELYMQKNLDLILKTVGIC